jgi:hypothetical protein
MNVDSVSLPEPASIIVLVGIFIKYKRKDVWKEGKRRNRIKIEVKEKIE